MPNRLISINDEEAISQRTKFLGGANILIVSINDCDAWYDIYDVRQISTLSFKIKIPQPQHSV
jgi:hypothetical protein